MSNTKRANNAHHDGKTATPHFMKDIGKSLLISTLIALALNLIASLALYFTPNPAPLTRPAGLVTSALTALLGGIIAVRIHRHAALLCGLANGCAMLALILTASLFFKPFAAGYSVPSALGLHLAFLGLSLVGALMGIRQRSAHPVKRRKR